MKNCTRCKIDKSLGDFHKNSSRPDGFQSACKLCCSKANSNSYKTRAETRAKVKSKNKARRIQVVRFINKYKTYCGCRACREKEPSCLDFHHLDPETKEGNIGELTRYSIKRVREEIKKCIVLCSNCHRKLHAGKLIL